MDDVSNQPDQPHSEAHRYRKITSKELKNILVDHQNWFQHQEWFQTDRPEGRKADLRNANLAEANLAGANLNEGMPGAGGFDLAGPWGAAVSANITPDLETGIGSWTDQQIKDALTKGVRPDGSVLGLPMPVYYLRNVSEDDLDALITWLRTLKPIQHRVK